MKLENKATIKQMGNDEFIAYFSDIRKHKTKSCGCFRKSFNKASPKWRGVGEISQSIFYSLKRGAESRNLEFLITLEDIWNLFIKQNRRCFFTNRELNFPSGRRIYNGTASLDRIDSSKGYILNNIQWVHKDINYMKQEMNNEEFLLTIKEIYNNKYE